jgi:long-chain acyl-CoA synthetase
MTGDLGRVDASGHLQLFGRKKNMIVTAEGKNIYPEDIENIFEGIAVKEFCVFAANYIWPQHTMTGEQLVLVLRLDPGRELDETLVKELTRRNSQLLNYKRVSGYVVWDADFPRNAAMKIRRVILAGQIGKQLDRNAMVSL